MKIIKTKTSEELSEYELKDLNKRLQADWFVYYYETGSYEGSGFAVWKTKEGKFGYHNMGHCSCYGPTDHMEVGMVFDSLEEIEKVITNYNHGQEVVDLIRKRAKGLKI